MPHRGSQPTSRTGPASGANPGGEPARPFIFIAALPRTGSTLLAELLTDLPTSFVFREPALCRGVFKVKPDDIERFRALGVDLDAFAAQATRPKGLLRRKPTELVSAFAEDLLPSLRRVVEQVGVKEVDLEGWQHYVRAIPDTRIILLGRDPRDIYLSLNDRTKLGFGLSGEAAPSDNRPLDPARAAEHIAANFAHQQDIAERHDALRLTYEALVTQPSVFEHIRRYVASPLTTPGRAGGLNETNPRRQHEAELHAGEVTTRRLQRWQQLDEHDPLREAALRTFELLGPYNSFWGYTREGLAAAPAQAGS